MKYLKGLIVFSLALTSAAWGDLVQKDNIIHYAKKRPFTLRGEDGVLEEVFRRLNIKKGFFVHIGAQNGYNNSRVRQLFLNGWHGALIDDGAADYTEMQIRYHTIEDKARIQIHRAKIKGDKEPGPGITFDDLADEYFPKQPIDLLCITTMGNEHLILESLKRQPKVLCVLGGFSWHPHYKERVPDHIAAKNLQQPLHVMCQIAKLKGYRPICFTESTIFVKKAYEEFFEGYDKDPVSLWKDGWNFTDDRHREAIANFRERNPDIRNTEGDAFKELYF